MAAVSVQSLAANGMTSIPAEFIRPEHERTGANTNGPPVQVPLIDMANLCGPGLLREKSIAEIGSAACEWGLFQVVNHGIPEELIQRLQAVGKEFFDLPQEEKESYSNNAAAGVLEGYGTRLAHNIDGKLEWIDYFFHILWPPSRRDFKTWPRHPSSYVYTSSSSLSIYLLITACFLHDMTYLSLTSVLLSYIHLFSHT